MVCQLFLGQVSGAGYSHSIRNHGAVSEDIIVALPQINLPQIHDTLSYYYEHKSEIDSTWKAAIQETEGMKKMRSSILEKKLTRLKIYTDENVDIRIAEGLKSRGVKAFLHMGKA